MRILLVSCLLLMVASAAAPQSTTEPIDKIFEAYYEELLRASPEQATSVGRTEYDDRWSDFSASGRASWRAKQSGFIEQLEAIDAASLDEQRRISRALLLRALRQSLEGARLEDALLPFNQLFGYHTRVFLTINEMPARKVRDYENIIARLRAVPSYVDGAIEALREGVDDGLTQPRYIAETIAGQIESQAAFAAADSPLLKAFREIPETIAESERARLLSEAEAAYRDSFKPAWAKLQGFVAETYAARGRSETAAASLPNGKEIYEYLVRLFTTTSYTPDEIHEIGLRETARIDAEIDTIARREGFGSGEAYERSLRAAPEQRFGSKEEMLVYCRNLAKIIDPDLPLLFKTLPRMPFGIRPIPEDREAASASNYSAPAIDGSRAGFFNLKAYKPEEQWKFAMHSLILHETNPGHHLQVALQNEIEGLPEFRKVYHVGAYVEGWALYAEVFGEQLGVYDDAASRFSGLDSERFRAKRLVVDTGLHAKGWSRARAIEYMGEEYTSEVDRYIAWPGQALSYKMGQLKITELREKAQAAVGERFDIREFHDVVLRNGALPLDLLEEQVDSWVKSLTESGSGG